MNWFEGEIAQAIVTSKAKQAIFVVYVYGNDEKSSQITELINKEEVAKVLSGDSFVAIKVEAESVSYQQFSQIYKQVPVPSIYFIGKQGVPLSIVTEIKDVSSFLEQLNTILQKGGLTPIATQTQDFISKEQVVLAPTTSTDAPTVDSAAEAASPTKPDNIVCENNVCYVKKDEKPSSSQESKSEEAKPEEKEDTSELSVEEKVERAKQLVEKKREEKRKEEFENERQQEIERRKMGQNVQQLKRWQEDQELKQVLEEREREKRESQAARDRVLAQIAQDKAERAAKFSPVTPPPPPAPTPQASPRPVNTNTARLQFKMPDGRTSNSDFPSSDTLESVHTFIRANLSLPFSTYTLSTTFPRREFTDNDKNQSLLELGLVPTAVILILPTTRGTVTTSTTGGFTGFLWSLLTPVFTILGYLKTFVFGSGPPPNTGNNDNQNKRAAETSNEPRVQPKIRKAGETTVIRRQGNIHRLSNKNDSDDENNTWNGNSTQQM